MPGLTQQDLEVIFTHVPSRPDQVPHYEAIRTAAKVFAQVLMEHTPSSPDQTAAIRKLREVVWTANGSVAMDGRY